MRVPTSYDDITVLQCQQIDALLKSEPDLLECDTKILMVLTGKSYDYIQSLDFETKWFWKPSLNKWRRKIAWVHNPKFKDNKRKYVIINWKIYKAITNTRYMNKGRYTDIMEFRKRGTTIEQLHNLLACTYIPLSRKGFVYNGIEHPKIAADMLNVKMGKVYPTVFFYSKTLMKSTNSIVDYGLNQVQKIIDQVLMETQKENLETIGDGK